MCAKGFHAWEEAHAADKREWPLLAPMGGLECLLQQAWPPPRAPPLISVLPCLLLGICSTHASSNDRKGGSSRTPGHSSLSGSGTMPQRWNTHSYVRAPRTRTSLCLSALPGQAQQWERMRRKERNTDRMRCSKACLCNGFQQENLEAIQLQTKMNLKQCGIFPIYV